MAEQNAVIPISTKPTGNIELAGMAAGCFQVPAAFTGPTIEVKFSIDGVTFTTVQEEGNETNPITVAAGGTYAIPRQTFGGKYMQLASASNEAAARTIAIYLRK